MEEDLPIDFILKISPLWKNVDRLLIFLCPPNTLVSRLACPTKFPCHVRETERENCLSGLLHSFLSLKTLQKWKRNSQESVFLLENWKQFLKVYYIAYEAFEHSEFWIETFESRYEMLACTERKNKNQLFVCIGKLKALLKVYYIAYEAFRHSEFRIEMVVGPNWTTLRAFLLK